VKNFRAVLVLALVFGTLAATARAQGVGINATGAAADTSAILDLSATNKGFLPPRMTSVQRAAIVLPATGLLVYQTDGTPGLYYNTGTPAAPNWRLVGDAANTGPWSLNGSSAYYNGGNVGIGTSSPTHPLSVVSSLNGLRVQTNSAGGAALSVGGFGAVGVDAPGLANGRLSLLENGNLGLGVANPTSKLSFAAVGGKKISLYRAGLNDYGFGIGSGRLQIFNDGTPGGDVAIGTDAAGTFTERLAVKSNGALAVNGSTGSPGQVLQSNGAGAAATWVNPTSATYNNVYVGETTTLTTLPANGASIFVPGLTVAFNTTGNARLIVTLSVELQTESCFACADASVVAGLVLDGGSPWVGSLGTQIPSNQFRTVSVVKHLQVGAGTHTLAVVAHSYEQATTVNNGCQLIVQVIPQ